MLSCRYVRDVKHCRDIVFLMQKPKTGASSEASRMTITNEDELIDTVLRQSMSMRSIMSARLTNIRVRFCFVPSRFLLCLQAVRTLWSTGDIRGAVDRVAELGDAAVMVDFLAVVSQKYVLSV